MASGSWRRGSLTLLVYSWLLLAVMVVGAPYWLARMIFSGRYRAGLAGRLGRVPAGLRSACLGKDVVWLHAVSVGEVLAATRLVSELQAALPGWVVAVSTTTATGQALARERFAGSPVFYLPLDFGALMRRYLGVLRPRLVVLMESELWPNMIHECRKAGVPLAVVNARVSDRSFPRYMRLRRLWGPLLREVSLFLAQSEETAGRLRAMGVAAERVVVAGNLKYDVRAAGATAMVRTLRPLLERRRLVVAGSLLDPEEKLLLGLWLEVRSKAPEVVLLIAPRHPSRFGAVSSMTEAGLTMYRASELQTQSTSEQPLNRLKPLAVIVLDTIGDLAAVYGLADISFVGGSLSKHGGHNPLEPAQFGVPVVMGSSFENFRDVVERMWAADGIAIVRDIHELKETFIRLLTDRDGARELGERGRAVFKAQRGATARVVRELVGLVR